MPSCRRHYAGSTCSSATGCCWAAASPAPARSRPAELAAGAGIRASTVSTALARLSRRKLVTRQRPDDDQRTVRVHLTEADAHSPRATPRLLTGQGRSAANRHGTPCRLVACRPWGSGLVDRDQLLQFGGHRGQVVRGRLGLRGARGR
ncbi:MarR family transcriptional regulator [Krasilnikovia sp. M28-CT-15]|uniref:MarR family transcriptional regulator n=1 Tax=Krasilnikovia sp. M28-CT-15 TaxID=3373540 RepID=UPI00399CBE1D